MSEGKMDNFENAVIFRDLKKSFGETEVLRGVDFKIAKGKITSILGFSGAGKSTLLKHILGVLQPSSGDVEVLGTNLAKLKGVTLRKFRQNFGMLFQYAALFDSLTTFDNIAFPLKEFSKLGKNEVEARVDELLEAVGLDLNTKNRLPSELSGGMRKRVGLARSLALDPLIMIYDEPTTGLDPITTKMVNDLIVETAYKNRQKTMTSIIISHDIKATLEISDYIAFLDRGKIIEYAPTDHFMKTENPTVRKFLDL